MSERLKIWWYNAVKRHWNDWRAWRELGPAWIAEGRDPAIFPRSGRLTPEAIEWAKSVTERIASR